MKPQISIYTATAIVIANMIGTGVFTSLGFQLAAVQNTWSIILLWAAGGFIALFGAFAYAELGTHFKDSGGDYIYLSRLVHPLAGYLSGWTGLTVGFSAPVALAAMAFTKYLAPIGLQGNRLLAIAVVVLIGLLHSFTIRHSSRLQNFSTLVKILFITTLIVVAFILHPNTPGSFNFNASWQQEVTTPGFAVSMVYVSFAYTGWNAAAYVADEIKNPLKNLPLALIVSTVLVSVLYIFFQLALLRHGSVGELAAKEEVTYISYTNLLGVQGGKWVSIFIAIQLIATISSYLWVGPRVTAALARENKLWQWVAYKNKNGIPVAAIWLHVCIAILLTVTGSFESVLLYASLILQVMASLTVASSIWLKVKAGGEFKSPFKPVLQIIFLVFNAWIIFFTVRERPLESLAGIAILLLGVIIYYFDRPIASKS